MYNPLVFSHNNHFSNFAFFLWLLRIFFSLAWLAQKYGIKRAHILFSYCSWHDFFFFKKTLVNFRFFVFDNIFSFLLLNSECWPQHMPSSCTMTSKLHLRLERNNRKDKTRWLCCVSSLILKPFSIFTILYDIIV